MFAKDIKDHTIQHLHARNHPQSQLFKLVPQVLNIIHLRRNAKEFQTVT